MRSIIPVDAADALEVVRAAQVTAERNREVAEERRRAGRSRDAERNDARANTISEAAERIETIISVGRPVRISDDRSHLRAKKGRVFLGELSGDPNTPPHLWLALTVVRVSTKTAKVIGLGRDNVEVDATLNLGRDGEVPWHWRPISHEWSAGSMLDSLLPPLPGEPADRGIESQPSISGGGDDQAG